MNRYLLCLLLITQGATAQPGSRNVALLHYALDSFGAGTVLLRNGNSSKQTLNYNVLTGEMIFVSNGQCLALAAPQDVDTVFLGSRKFVPVDEKFYEWLGGTQPALYKEYTGTVKEPGVEAGFGGKTATTAAAALTNFIQSGGAYQLRLPDEFQVIPGHAYWVRKGENFYKLANTKQLANLYPAKKNWIEDWWKKAAGRFANTQDVTRLVLAMQTPVEK